MLVDLMTQWGLNLHSPTGIFTHGLGSATTKGTTINLVFVNDSLDEHIQMCTVNEEDLTSQLFDHQAIITTFLTCRTATGKEETHCKERKNWAKVDISLLKHELTMTLPLITNILTREAVKKKNVHNIRPAVIKVLNKYSPRRPPRGKHKEWWDPTLLNPLQQEANKAKRKLKKLGTEDNQAQYNKARNRFYRAVDKEKEDSWKWSDP
ncbi:hypothetical protein CROQUDRAFT_133550 [Cronartium quercuum f. sp. fusiforme G11]|uniref:Reverse transcriptase domain-containing protein n=1 Tax=Cronartium quercuum f. sp. fusiforme G11 TaxID=708437 RepID=A0A9P6NLL4_9BASI|nr:hypothetical protein CROQUDRAFT_133550 [Cronartium quercuum f. sp. fusiforme G11]